MESYIIHAQGAAGSEPRGVHSDAVPKPPEPPKMPPSPCAPYGLIARRRIPVTLHCACRSLTERMVTVHNHNTEKPRSLHYFTRCRYRCACAHRTSRRIENYLQMEQEIRGTNRTRDERRGSNVAMANRDSSQPKAQQLLSTGTFDALGRVIEASSRDPATHELTPLSSAGARIQGSNGRSPSQPSKQSKRQRQPTNCWIASRSAGGNALICSGVSCST